jgi:hypothetical protein
MDSRRASAAKKPFPKSIEEDKRILANTLKGDAKIKAGIGKRFKDSGEFLDYPRKL